MSSHGLTRILEVASLSLATPARRAMAGIANLFHTVRAGGAMWLLMAPIRVFQFLPFTLIDSLYYSFFRKRSFSKAAPYSSAVFYKTRGDEMSLRNFLVDLDNASRDKGPHIEAIEVIIDGGGEPERFFAAATLFPLVRDLHFYTERAQLESDLLEYFPRRPAADNGRPNVDLDDYPHDKVLAWVDSSAPLIAPDLKRGDLSLSSIFMLSGKRPVVVLNLDETGDAAAFLNLLSSLKQAYTFLLFRPLPTEKLDALNKAGRHYFFYASQLGYDFSDCLWLVRNVDAYVGRLDEFGIMAAGTEVPALLLASAKDAGESKADEAAFRHTSRVQTIAVGEVAPRQIFDEFQRLCS